MDEQPLIVAFNGDELQSMRSQLGRMPYDDVVTLIRFLDKRIADTVKARRNMSLPTAEPEANSTAGEGNQAA